jgi:hypothetical protein
MFPLDMCTAKYCTTNGGWSKWGSFGDCSATCGGESGTRSAINQLKNPNLKIVFVLSLAQTPES